ncbi:hypothetical protein HYS28_02700 [Candidatus Uhrbacteria bacterium]|nr:hypothetical protein [Candidatus Uhrbacteria bacterium]
MNIAYSTNNGDSYTAIVSDTANDGSYTWTVPDIDSDQVFIRIQGTDLATVLAYDRSDSEFTIGTVAASDDEDTTDEDEDTSSDDSDTAETSDDVTVPSSGETGASPVTGETEEISAVEAGMYVRSVYFDTVYYLEGQDDGSIVRRPFMDSQTYFTYFDSWDEVETVTDATLPTLTLGAPMLPQAGVVLVKIQSVAKVYAIEGDGELRWVTSESVAEEIYGEDWADYVIDIPDTLWPRFDQGDDIDSDEGFDTSNMKTRMEVNS